MRFLSLVSLLLPLFSGLLTPVSAQMTVAVVDVQTAIFEYKKTRELTDALEKRLAQHAAACRQDEDVIRSKIDAIESLASEHKDSPVKILQLQKEIKLCQVDLEVKKSAARYELEQNLVAHMKKVYKDIIREVESIARDRKIQMVLMKRGGEIEGKTKDEVIGNILIRGVLYADATLDLTTEVIQRLNR